MTHAGAPSTAMAQAAARVERLRESLGARLVQTHISWVLLTDDHAWKIKKPVRLGFLDCRSRHARQHLCEEELRLNRRLAPDLYLGVATVTGTPEHPCLEGTAPVLDHAVKMRRFADGALLSERLAGGHLHAADVDRLAQRLAEFHRQAPVAAADSGFGTPERVAGDLRAVVRRLAGSDAGFDAAPWRDWVEQQACSMTATWARRLREGFVREVHGDLHLANLVDLDGDITAFDAIEFDPALRWIDVASDIAFAVMDLHAHGRPDLAMRLLDGWLSCTGDHGAVTVLRSYLVYRALVRALVRNLTVAPDRRPGDACTGASPTARQYLAEACRWRDAADPRLLITEGLPGSGKTWVTTRLLARCGAIRWRSDVERKRLHGLASTDRSPSPPGQGLYTDTATAQVYAQLERLAREGLQAGWPLIIDASFAQAAARRRMRALAQSLKVPFAILCCEAPDDELRRRLQLRRRQGTDASDADAAVLTHARGSREPLAPDEQALALPMAAAPDVEELARRWRALQGNDDEHRKPSDRHHG